MVVCVECLPADKPWDVVSVTRRSSGVAPRACVRVYARVLVPPNLYIHTHIEHMQNPQKSGQACYHKRLATPVKICMSISNRAGRASETGDVAKRRPQKSVNLSLGRGWDCVPCAWCVALRRPSSTRLR